MEAIKALLKQVTSYWAGKDKRFKRNAIVIASSVLVFVIILTIILNQVPYATLYSGLSGEDASAVMQALDDQKEPYKVKEDAILVPAKDVDKLRMSLSAQVKGGFSLDILKQGQGLGFTESQMEDYRKAQLEENLRKSIMTVKGVKDAFVLLTIPDESQFVLSSSNRDSTASLLLSLDSGVELTPNQVKMIKLFVQNAVPGLTQENISIMDTSMQYLDGGSEAETEFGETGDQFALQSEVEAKLRRQVMALLIPIFGMGRVEAQVNVVLNYDDKTSDSKTFTPVVGDSKGIEVSADRLREQIENGADTAAEPGVDANTGTDTYPVVTGSNGTYEKTEEKVNLEVNSVYQHVQEAKGKIEGLSVSVVIDSTTYKDNLTENVRNLVKNAVGADVGNISVEYMPMQAAQDVAKALNGGTGPAGMSLGLIAAIGAAAVLVAVFLAYLYAKSRRNAEAAAVQAAVLATQTEAQTEAESPAEGGALPDIGIVKDSSAKEQIGKLIELNPELVANLLRSWLADEQE
jgi:flagellar M-ring protein FliF